MTAFQGEAGAGLSPILCRILEGMGGAQPVAERMQTALAVAGLSRLFTKEREALGRAYLDDPALEGAYLRYFLPVNLCKIQVLLDELPADWCRTADHRPIRVLDLGTGPGTGALAVLDWINHHDPGYAKELTVVAVDSVAAALRRARGLWTAYCRQINISDANLILHEGDLRRPQDKRWDHDVVQGKPYDLIIMANCLNELFGGTRHPIKERSGLLADLLLLLAPHGTLMLLEPALRETSRALHEVRDVMLQDKRCTVYSPCLHQGNCPALVNPDDWCHEERGWKPPSTVQQIDRDVGFIKDALKFSYLLLRTDGRTIAERSSDTFRMVSELRKLKGDTRAWLCNELGRCEVGRLDRAKSGNNCAWDACQRGTILKIESVTRKDGATLGRIPAEGLITIIRPV